MPTPFAVAAATPPPPVLTPEAAAVLSGHQPLDPGVAHDAALWLWQAAWSVGLIAVLAWVALRAWDWVLARSFRAFESRLPEDAARRLARRFKTGQDVLRSVGKAGISFIAVTMALSRVGVNVAPVLASAGILGLAVGIGAQSLVKDVISGFFIIMEDQYGVGDLIEAAGHTGHVERMNLRITQIRSSLGAVITLPNGQITNVVNHSKQWSRAVVDVTVPLRVSTARALADLKGAAARLAADPEVLEEPEVLGLESLKDDSYAVRVRFKTAPLAHWRIAREFRAAMTEVALRWRTGGAPTEGADR
ncbi:MAG: mechanosensitive ion channel family protein [Candidatus Sericytochromatia bacterium]|nr:mechanosensitive ion channel family protein [Candidatus Sericytochromatia bacterium]